MVACPIVRIVKLLNVGTSSGVLELPSTFSKSVSSFIWGGMAPMGRLSHHWLDDFLEQQAFVEMRYLEGNSLNRTVQGMNVRRWQQTRLQEGPRHGETIRSHSTVPVLQLQRASSQQLDITFGNRTGTEHLFGCG